MTRTAFFFDDRCLWHVGRLHVVTLPVGGWVEPLDQVAGGNGNGGTP